jgi:nucleolin
MRRVFTSSTFLSVSATLRNTSINMLTAVSFKAAPSSFVASASGARSSSPAAAATRRGLFPSAGPCRHSRGFSVIADAESNEGGEENKLYIGNLSWETTDETLSAKFANYDVKDCAVVIDRMNGRSRGFAFVTVGNAEAMNNAIQALDGADIDGREIRVSQAQAREARSEREPRERREPRGDRPMGGRGGREGGRGRPMDNDNRRVYFGNLSWGMDHLDLQDLCAEFGTVDDSRLITDRETGRSRGFGFVTMSSEDEAQMVVNQLNGQDVDGRVLRVNIANSD